MLASRGKRRDKGDEGRSEADTSDKFLYTGYLVDRVRRVTAGLIDVKQGGFRAGRGCVDQIFTLKQMGEKAREKKCNVYASFIDLEKAYDRVNREALWQVLRINDVGGVD